MNKYNLLAPKGYPMYQKIKFDINGIEGQYEVGTGLVDIVSDGGIKVGDKLSFNHYTMTVASIEEQREPRGKHKDGAVFQRLLFDYAKPMEQ